VPEMPHREAPEHEDEPAQHAGRAVSE
jgi:hypothetical protein